MSERIRLKCGCIAKGFSEAEAHLIEEIHLGEMEALATVREEVDELVQSDHPLKGLAAFFEEDA